VTSVSAGFGHSLAVRSDGTVWAWGDNSAGQLGDGTETASLTPVQVVGPGGSGFLTGIIAVAVSRDSVSQYSLALRSDGTVWAWGFNWDNELGDGTTTNSLTPVQVLGAGGSGFLTGVKAIAAGWGANLALRSDGTVWTWGYTSPTPTAIPGPGGRGRLSGVSAIATGYTFNAALKSNGTVWTWGWNDFGQLGNGSFTYTYVAAPVQVVGPNGHGVLATVTAIAAGNSHCLALRRDGSVWAWGSNHVAQMGDASLANSPFPVRVKSADGSGYLTGAKAIAAGSWHSLTLRADGTVWAWGWNVWGQLGDGTYSDGLYISYYPVQAVGLTNVTALSAGVAHSLAIK
jgi:alpha-tubulin suppressor-like RCC1 family protein